MIAVYIRISSHSQKTDSQKAEIAHWLTSQKLPAKQIIWFEDMKADGIYNGPPFKNCRKQYLTAQLKLSLSGNWIVWREIIGRARRVGHAANRPERYDRPYRGRGALRVGANLITAYERAPSRRDQACKEKRHLCRQEGRHDESRPHTGYRLTQTRDDRFRNCQSIRHQ